MIHKKQTLLSKLEKGVKFVGLILEYVDSCAERIFSLKRSLIINFLLYLNKFT